ncbi:hypothetical protein BDW74DRAFT_160979 [Aspergillus multicolor]|uniref:uncharacterized protein n=1 Tax=Aspergillus multicolor TaxID=41759 RepID=UPI003CCDB5DC
MIRTWSHRFALSPSPASTTAALCVFGLVVLASGATRAWSPKKGGTVMVLIVVVVAGVD